MLDKEFCISQVMICSKICPKLQKRKDGVGIILHVECSSQGKEREKKECSCRKSQRVNCDQPIGLGIRPPCQSLTFQD
jgi:hypothetical protein